MYNGSFCESCSHLLFLIIRYMQFIIKILQCEHLIYDVTKRLLKDIRCQNVKLHNVLHCVVISVC